MKNGSAIEFGRYVSWLLSLGGQQSASLIEGHGVASRCVPLFGVTANLEGRDVASRCVPLFGVTAIRGVASHVFCCLELRQSLEDGALLHDVFRCLESRQTLKDETVLQMCPSVASQCLPQAISLLEEWGTATGMCSAIWCYGKP